MPWKPDLIKAMVQTLSASDLQLLLVPLDKSPENYAGPKAAHPFVVDAVVQASENEAWTPQLVSELLRQRPAGFAAFRTAYPQFAPAALKDSERGELETGLRAAFRAQEDIRGLVTATDPSTDLDKILFGLGQPAPADMIAPVVAWFDARGQTTLLIGAALQLNHGPVLAMAVQHLTKALRARSVASGFTPIDPIEACLISQRVFINRLALRDAIKAWWPNAVTPIVAIDGGERVGKTFSVELIRHVAATKRSFELASIDLGEEQQADFNPKALARRILFQMGRSGELTTMPTETEAGSRWFIEMCDWLEGIAKISGTVWVITLDGFFHPDLPQSTRDMVMELVKRAARAGSALRLVLIQYSDSLSPNVCNRVRRETIASPSREDLLEYFRRLSVQHAIDIDQQGVDFIVDDIAAKTSLVKIEEVAVEAQRWVDVLLPSNAPTVQTP